VALSRVSAGLCVPPKQAFVSLCKVAGLHPSG
jgi:hypothetical protein